MPEPTRVVHHADALEWLQAEGRLVHASVITSLPDLSELPSLDLGSWQEWFTRAALLTMGALDDDGIAIFFQSDIVHEGVWIDKSWLLQRAAEQAGLCLLFHSIACRKPPGATTFGRAGFSHLVAFARRPARRTELARIDVLPDVGFKPGSKAMGVTACRYACQFIISQTNTRTIVDPFCGWGTALAVANALGLDAVGVDISARKCRRARALQVDLA